MTRKDFPGAPSNAYICKEGWLVVGDQAWTVAEWAAMPPEARPHSPRIPKPAPERRIDRRIKYHTEEERREAIRRSNREYMRRKRAAA